MSSSPTNAVESRELAEILEVWRTLPADRRRALRTIARELPHLKPDVLKTVVGVVVMSGKNPKP